MTLYQKYKTLYYLSKCEIFLDSIIKISQTERLPEKENKYGQYKVSKIHSDNND